MHRQDTARLNAQALATRIREQGVKQYMLARAIGVEPLTVNRWLTGKVKRISRDNLDRLSNALGCNAEDLSHMDEADVRATQVEQSQAARMLVEPRAQAMFQLAGDFELYEKLLKAVMHANLPLSDLCEVYNQLTKASIRQQKFADAREYARLTLDYAQRCGNTDREFSALSNLAAVDGEVGMLGKARAQLEHVVSFAESVGSGHGRAIASINLMHAYRLQADWHGAIRTANSCVQYLRDSGNTNQLHHGLVNISSIARDTGQYALALKLRREADNLPELVVSGWTKTYIDTAVTLLESLAGDTKGAADRLRTIYPEVQKLGRMVEDNHVTSASVFRRAGDLEAAQAHLAHLETNARLGPYDPPFIAAEAARIAAARGDGQGARRLRKQANTQFAALDMARWATDDPAVEVGAQFTPPPRLKLKVLP